MRTLLTILVSMSFLVTTAQSHLPIDGLGYGFNQFQLRPFMPASFAGTIDPNKKWQLRQYASLSAGYLFYGGGGISYLSAPVGLMLFHPLNKNVSAFAGVSAAPVFFSANRFSTDHMAYPGNASRGYGLGGNARVEAGLMYTNDDKTFSISGSIGIEKGGYPVYPANRLPASKQ